jgi:hypothetical protein
MADTTMKQYTNIINRLKTAKVNPLSVEEVNAYFESKGSSLSSKKQVLSAIKKTYPSEFPAEFQTLLTNLYLKQNENDKEQKLTPKQKKQYLSWKQITDARNKTDGATDLENTLYALYTIHPPARADYGDFLVVKRGNTQHKGNYIVWNENPYFVFQSYKTQATYGKVIIYLTKELKQAITDWFNTFPSTPKYLLGNEIISPHTLSNMVQDLFEKRTGVRTGISLLRHAYISNAFKNPKFSLKEREALSRKMFHSVETQEKYRVLLEDDVEDDE